MDTSKRKGTSSTSITADKQELETVSLSHRRNHDTAKNAFTKKRSVVTRKMSLEKCFVNANRKIETLGQMERKYLENIQSVVFVKTELVWRKDKKNSSSAKSWKGSLLKRWQSSGIARGLPGGVFPSISYFRIPLLSIHSFETLWLLSSSRMFPWNRRYAEFSSFSGSLYSSYLFVIPWVRSSCKQISPIQFFFLRYGSVFMYPFSVPFHLLLCQFKDF